MLTSIAEGKENYSSFNFLGLLLGLHSINIICFKLTSLALWKHRVNLLLIQINRIVISTDEGPSLWIESFATTNLRGVSTKQKELITELDGKCTNSSFKRLDRLTKQRLR